MGFYRGDVSNVKQADHRQLVQVQALEGETLDDVEHFQPLGWYYVPATGAEAVLLGDRAHPVAVAVDDPALKAIAAALNLQENEGALVNAGGAVVHLKADGSLAIVGNTTITGNLVVSGNIAATGNVSDSAGSMATMRSKYASDTHGGAAVHANTLN